MGGFSGAVWGEGWPGEAERKGMMTTYGDLMEGSDKALFLEWLHAEMGILGTLDPEERKQEINRICQRWIKYKIRKTREQGQPNTPYTDQEERFSGGGVNGWNRVTTAEEIRDCGESAQDLESIAAIESRGHIAVRATVGNDSAIREFVDEAEEVRAREIFWKLRATDRGIRL